MTAKLQAELTHGIRFEGPPDNGLLGAGCPDVAWRMGWNSNEKLALGQILPSLQCIRRANHRP
jgi:hypothetical protein